MSGTHHAARNSLNGCLVSDGLCRSLRIQRAMVPAVRTTTQTAQHRSSVHHRYDDPGDKDGCIFCVDGMVQLTPAGEKYKDIVKAIIPTHAHLDHLGAIPFLANKFKAPVFAIKIFCIFKKIITAVSWAYNVITMWFKCH